MAMLNNQMVNPILASICSMEHTVQHLGDVARL
jgi:hypothetical protein